MRRMAKHVKRRRPPWRLKSSKGLAAKRESPDLTRVTANMPLNRLLTVAPRWGLPRWRRPSGRPCPLCACKVFFHCLIINSDYKEPEQQERLLEGIRQASIKLRSTGGCCGAGGGRAASPVQDAAFEPYRALRLAIHPYSQIKAMGSS